VFGRENPAAVARVIGAVGPDVVALQEVTFMNSGPDGTLRNQAEWIGALLEMDYRFHATRPARVGEFGLALLSRYPITKIKAGALPDVGGRVLPEARGAMWYRMETDHGPVHVLNTHLALRRRDRAVQIRKLLSSAWVGDVPADEPLIFCGDLNADAISPVYRALSSRYTDVQRKAGRWGYPRRTFPSLSPILRLDHIFISSHLSVRAVKVPLSLEARTASDHLPVCVQLERNGSG
jgi:endonuclease/exonuclease/phosphatase family metal-dependent hydrolase